MATKVWSWGPKSRMTLLGQQQFTAMLRYAFRNLGIHRQEGDLIILLLFFRNKESMLKMEPTDGPVVGCGHYCRRIMQL
jgi:hypothetical protein